MRKRFVIAAACILGLPLFFSPSQSQLTNPTPYATVALAGHTLMGEWCQCGTPGCICDPGEQSAKPAPSNPSSGSKRVKGTAPDLDVASGVFNLALVLLFLMRMQ